MDTPSHRSDLPRGIARTAERSETVIWAVAAVLAAIFALGQIITVLVAAPAAIAFHREMGDVPAIISAADILGPIGIGALLTLIDAIIFWFFYALARRHWVGLAYLPPLLYMGIGSMVLWLLLAEAVGRTLFAQ